MPRPETFDATMATPTAKPEHPGATTRSSYVVGRDDAPEERHADRFADDALRALQDSTAWATLDATGGAGRVRRSTAAPTGAVTIGARGGELDDETASDLDRAIGGGHPLPVPLQHDIASATGTPTDRVRIHTDARAGEIARTIQASAFTVGSDVFFAKGQFRPDTPDGMRTMLHEIAHVGQNQTRVQRSAIRRTISTTTDDMDAMFKHRTGLKGLRDSMSGSEIPKIRDALKRYHAAQGKGPDKVAAALQSLIKHTDVWLAKHSRASDPGERARIDFIDSIRTEASMEYGRSQAEAIYMGDAKGRLSGPSGAESGPGANPMKHLKHFQAFQNPDLYENRSSTDATTKSGQAVNARDKLVKSGELKAQDPTQVAALEAGMNSLSPAEFAAVHTYTGADYEYMNPNIGGWGKGDKTIYEESGLHGGFMAEAFRKLPIWRGTTYRGMSMEQDFLGVTTAASYTPKEFWSTSEAKSVAQSFLNISAFNKKPTMAAICTIQVVNGRDVSRMSNSPGELEILLPPSSIMNIAGRKKLMRGTDDDEIKQHFGTGFFDKHTTITEFWLIDMKQQFSGDKDVVGAYGPPKKATPPKMPPLPSIPGS